MTAYDARLRELGAELKAARLRANLTQKQAAQGIARDQSLISRWEQGKALPERTALGALFLVYGITDDEEQEVFLRLAREAADPNWVSPGVSRGLAALIASEKAARRIVNVELLLIPGLCQTEAYARAVALTMGATQEQADQRAKGRLERQAVLTRSRAPEYLTIISEHALLYPPRYCDVTAMTEQLEKLLTLSSQSNISIFVLPLARVADTPAVYGSFALMEMWRGDPVVRLDPYRSRTMLANRRDVRDYQAAVDMIRRDAMNAASSIAFIGKLLKKMEHET